VRRHRAAAAAAGVAIAALAIGAIVSGLMWIRAERARGDARAQLTASLLANGGSRLEAWDWGGALLSFVKALETDPAAGSAREHRVRIAQVLERMPRLHRFWPHGQRVTSIDVSAAGLVASGGTDGHVRVWTLSTGDAIGSVLDHTGDVNDVAFSPDGLLLGSASDDGTAKIWRVRDRQPLAILRHQRAVGDITFAPDSKSVATASQDGRVRVWRIGDETPAFEIDLGAPVFRVMFTRDGSRFAAAARQTEQQPFVFGVWSTATGSPLGAVIRGQPGWWLADRPARHRQVPRRRSSLRRPQSAVGRAVVLRSRALVPAHRAARAARRLSPRDARRAACRAGGRVARRGAAGRPRLVDARGGTGSARDRARAAA
jgi:hypothetical protein